MKWSFLHVVGAVVLATCGVVTEASQTTPLGRIMREKLAHSQQMLDAVVTSNWAALEQHSVALQRSTQDPAWAGLSASPEYVRQTAGFVRTLDDLVDAAKRHDLEAAPLAYVSMTLSCVQCHRYVARMRIARSAD